MQLNVEAALRRYMKELIINEKGHWNVLIFGMQDLKQSRQHNNRMIPILAMEILSEIQKMMIL